MPRYQVIGIPISPPFSVLQGLKVGDVFESEIDREVEQLLLGAGALRKLPPERKSAQPKQAEPKMEAPEPEEEKPSQKVQPTTERTRDAGKSST